MTLLTSAAVFKQIAENGLSGSLNPLWLGGYLGDIFICIVVPVVPSLPCSDDHYINKK